MGNLKNWVNDSRSHLKEWHPTLYRQLQQSGQLEAHLREAAEKTHQEMSELENAGMRPDEAWEIVSPKYLLPPPPQA